MEVVDLWRYPAKSLQGERLGAAAPEEDGVAGDRPVISLPGGRTAVGPGEFSADATDDSSEAIEWTMPFGRYVDAGVVRRGRARAGRTGGPGGRRRGITPLPLPSCCAMLTGVTGYNALSGRDLERILVLVDGVFAIVMTLLVLDLRLPNVDATTSKDLWDQLTGLAPQFTAYLLSFSMLGTFWLAEHTLLGHVRESDRTMAWAVFGFLFFVTTLPFTASTLADHVHLRLAVWLYWVNLLLLGLGLAWQLVHAARVESVTRDDPARRLIWRRLVLAQTLYAAGALVAIIDPVAGIVALAAVQLFFMVSPRLPWAL